MGMSAGYELARRGHKVLLFDAFDPPHTAGSHHGETRLIRHAYHGGDTYVKLALRADELWRDVEAASGEKLLERSGVINFADPALYSYDVRKDAAETNQLRVEWLDAEEIRRRWPAITIPDHFKGMYEPNAGYLYSEKCVTAYKRLALQEGAAMLTDTLVTEVQAESSGITIRTKDDIFIAGQVILSAGAWFKTLGSIFTLPIRTVRKVVGWFETNSSNFDAGVFPGFSLVSKEGVYYGFPSIGRGGLKIGRHDTGTDWEPGQAAAPFGAYPEDEQDLRLALETFMPGAAGRLLQSAVCKYELTPDDNFIIDTHPQYANVIVAGGFSGHGFKFSSFRYPAFDHIRKK